MLSLFLITIELRNLSILPILSVIFSYYSEGTVKSSMDASPSSRYVWLAPINGHPRHSVILNLASGLGYKRPAISKNRSVGIFYGRGPGAI